MIGIVDSRREPRGKGVGRRVATRQGAVWQGCRASVRSVLELQRSKGAVFCVAMAQGRLALMDLLSSRRRLLQTGMMTHCCCCPACRRRSRGGAAADGLWPGEWSAGDEELVSC